MIQKTKRAKAIKSFKGEARPRPTKSAETCFNLPHRGKDGRCVCKTPSGKIKKLPKDSCGLFSPKSPKSGPLFTVKRVKKARTSPGST